MQAFTTEIKVRISDINYGGHLGHDSLVSILHQSRLDFLKHIGSQGEVDCFGVGLVMLKLNVEYIAEAFLNDILSIKLQISEYSKASFTLEYLVYKNDKKIAFASTKMAAFDYQNKKIRRLPEEFILASKAYYKGEQS